jgi:hypothetical protein
LPVPAPTGGGTPPTTTKRDANNCDTNVPPNATPSGGGWIAYNPRDPLNGDRPTSAEACLEPPLGTGSGTAGIYPRGYYWARAFATDNGLNPSTTINACHLIGNQLGGDGTDLDNLFTCGRGTNTYSRTTTFDSMRVLERKIAATVDGGQRVYLFVDLSYSGNRTVPVSVTMAAETMAGPVQTPNPFVIPNAIVAGGAVIDLGTATRATPPTVPVGPVP